MKETMEGRGAVADDSIVMQSIASIFIAGSWIKI